MIKRLTQNPWLLFAPFLFYYAYYISINKWPTLYGDEIRYVDFARHLLRGFYSPHAPHVNLWNGPGYPLVLAIFIALRTHTIYITLMNALYQYLAVVLLYKSVRLVANNKIALMCGMLFALYPNALSVLAILYTEAFTCFLVSGFLYCASRYYIREDRKFGAIAGIVLGYLILTKIIFGYVVTICLAGCLTYLLFKLKTTYHLRYIKILLIAFAVSLPYLAYTYHITGKLFYWGNSGGMSLYWMSTPYENEYGDWKLPDLSNKQYPTLFNSQEADNILKKNHLKEINTILKYDDIKQDELFKQKAIANIKTHPIKFIKNYCFNISRMLFNFPYSYAYQDGAILSNLLTGSLILWTIIIGAIISWRNWRSLIFPIKLSLMVTGVYLLLSGALSAYPRQLDVILPVLFYWAGYLIYNLKDIDLKFAVKERLEEIDLMDMAVLDNAVSN